MYTILISVAVVLLFAAWLYFFVAGQLKGPRQKKTSDGHLYCKQGQLLSAAERLFHRSLVLAVGDQYLVMCKIRLADVITPKSSGNRSKWQTAFNKISAKHLDFVLCETESLTVVAAIELDDKSHQSKDAKKRDKVKNECCESADLPLIRVAAKRSYDVEDLRELLAGHGIVDTVTPEQGVTAMTALENDPEPAENVNPSVSVLPTAPVEQPLTDAPEKESPTALPTELPDESQATSAEPAAEEQSEESPECPKCSSPMGLRKASKGPNAGTVFWVCNDYPVCKGARRQ